MRFSIWPSPARPWNEILELTEHCERSGWDGVYFADHFMPNAADATPLDGDSLECFSIVAALAAAVPRLRLGTLVASVTYRHPAVIANIASAIDQVSGGRLLLGIGAGWQENEHRAYGIELGTVKERLDRFEEACEVVTGLLRAPRTTVHGKYFDVTDAPNQPAPAQPRLPLLIGGSGEKRTMRIAARYADEWNAWSTPEVLAHKVSVLRNHCESEGRDPAEIAVSTQALVFLSEDQTWLDEKRSADTGRAAVIGTPSEVVDILGRYSEAGADEFIVPDFTMGPMPRRKETCDLFIEQVAKHLAS
ncbi:MAG TPA: TIGR03560 family F420-dependent LLM class oxidoreductase [Acidimicrobiales bacterium]|nr:TIGR03560 family F420-dependent LLM class oxidoreductase [Acidimicrobiales bacterium]